MGGTGGGGVGVGARDGTGGGTFTRHTHCIKISHVCPIFMHF